MTSRTEPEKSHPSLWAVGLFLTATAFTLISFALFATELGGF